LNGGGGGIGAGEVWPPSYIVKKGPVNACKHSKQYYFTSFVYNIFMHYSTDRYSNIIYVIISTRRVIDSGSNNTRNSS
jgi:hypothetical protein